MQDLETKSCRNTSGHSQLNEVINTMQSMAKHCLFHSLHFKENLPCISLMKSKSWRINRCLVMQLGTSPRPKQQIPKEPDFVQTIYKCNWTKNKTDLLIHSKSQSLLNYCWINVEKRWRKSTLLASHHQNSHTYGQQKVYKNLNY